ncbi:MAG: response regulator [Caldilineaceae bacterium]
MTVSKPRALFVDNRQSTLQNWKEILELSGFAVHVYYVQTRDWVEECRRLAQRVRPHVAVLDLRLEEDYRPSDVSGMRLLEWMKSASPATGVVIYSAYLDAALDQQIAHLGAEFFNKGGASSKLLEMVHRLASKASAATRSNPIGWPNAWDQARIAERLLETVQADDVQTHNICEDLVHQLFPDAPHLVVQHLEGAVGVEPEPVSIGRSVVGYVQRDNLPVKKIVKIATSERVRQEKENYQSYIRDQVVGIYHTQLENSTLFWDLGASIYSLLAEEEQRLQSFLRFFQSTEDVAQIWQPIYWFFKNAWKYHYANAVSGEHSMYEEYSRCFKLMRKWPVLIFSH